MVVSLLLRGKGKSRAFGELENFLAERGLDKQLGCNGYKELGQSYMLTTSAKILLSSHTKHRISTRI